MIRLLVVAMISQSLNAASACRLWIKPELLKGRVAEVTIEIEGAAIQAASVKPGWALSITNDPSWKASVTGHAIVGAAFLSGREFLSMLDFLPEPGSSCGDVFSEHHSFAVNVTFYRNDELVRVPMNRSDLRSRP